jgi:hypothetical protein
LSVAFIALLLDNRTQNGRSSMSSISVYQDLVMTGPLHTKDALWKALVGSAEEPWRFDAAATDGQSGGANGEKGLIFKRTSDDAAAGAQLSLYPQGDDFYVSNVVPLENGQFTIPQYNTILSDFAEKLAKPVARRFGWTVHLTGSSEGIDDWLSKEAAAALRAFSIAANKSTGASHPFDERRWFDFIIAVFRSDGSVDEDRLARWLNEVEGWDIDSARMLAGDFRNGLDLLVREKETR